MDKLKPCPFCGDYQQLNYVELSNGLHYIECARCGAAPHRLGAWNRETAVKYWNSVNRWIPCSERLPGRFDSVLLAILSKNGYGEPAYYVTIGGMKNGTEFESYTGDICECETVTHWMPLPEPPKEGESDA